MLVGIVGKPNVGKSTFFKAATLADALIANYPFATIKPNSGVGFVKIVCADRDFQKQCNPRTGFCVSGFRFLPVQLIDVAGLVPGAHEGLGMGNQFLDDLRQADVLVHVIDVAGSTNEKGEPVALGSYDPAADVKFLEVELDMWYLGIIKKGWDKFARTVVQEKASIHLALSKQLSGLGVNEAMVEDAVEKLGLNPEKPQLWSDDDLMRLAQRLRGITKPMVMACNKIDLPGARANFERLCKEFPQYTFIACTGDYELALKEANKAGLISYVPGAVDFEVLHPEKLNEKQIGALNHIKNTVLSESSGIGGTGVQKVIDVAVLDVLKYIAIFPGGVTKLEDKDGNVLPDCFLMKSESTALDFAYRLHTDLGKNFICAKDVHTKRTVGKDFVLHHRDVIEIVSGK